MKITLTDAGKRFNRDWIFRHLSYEFTTGFSYAITGPNGSGKSTLLQVLAASVAASEGRLSYLLDDRAVSDDQIYRHVSIAAPYLEVIEEMTLAEFLAFHGRFKPFLPGMDVPTIIHSLQLEKSAHKQIRYYSSGMKQRVKLAQAFFSDTPLMLLDEPCTNLDAEGIALYTSLVRDYGQGRLIIVSSNDLQEYAYCEKRLNILDFKK